MLTYPLNRSRLSVDCVCSRAKNVQLYTTLRLPPLRTTGHTNCANVTQLVSMVENMHAGRLAHRTKSNTCRPGFIHDSPYRKMRTVLVLSAAWQPQRGNCSLSRSRML